MKRSKTGEFILAKSYPFDKFPSGKPAFVFNYTSGQVFLIHSPLDVARTMNSYLLASSDLEDYFDTNNTLLIFLLVCAVFLCAAGGIILVNKRYAGKE